MPQKRILYTLDEVKKILAKENDMDAEFVHIYEGCKLELRDFYGNHDVNSDSFIFQVDIVDG